MSANALYASARECGRAVVREMLPLEQAYAGLMAGTLAADRRGDLSPYTAPHTFAGLKHVCALWVQRTQDQRDRARGDIRRRIAPLIGVRAPPNRLLAEAHDVNGAAEFPFTEAQVEEIVRTAIWWSLQPARQS